MIRGRIVFTIVLVSLALCVACSTAGAAVVWQSKTVPNGNFETSGADTSWDDGGYAGLSGTATDYAGDVAKDILTGWQFAAGAHSYTHMSSGSRLDDTVDYATHGQIAKFDFSTSSTHRKHIAGYVTSEAIPGVTVGASRYMMDVYHRADGSVYGVHFGFMYGAISSCADVTTSWQETPSNNLWGAPYEVNAGLNTRQEGARASWVHTRVYWDNTGTTTETFGLTNPISMFNATEGYVSQVLPDGTVAIAYYTNQRGLDQALRLGAYATGNGGGAGAVYLDNYQLAVEIPEPATLSVLALGGLGLLLRRRRS